MIANYKEIEVFKKEHSTCILRHIPSASSNGIMTLHCDTHGSEIVCSIPYNNFCIHPIKCAGRNSCPRDYACSE